MVTMEDLSVEDLLATETSTPEIQEDVQASEDSNEEEKIETKEDVTETPEVKASDEEADTDWKAEYENAEKRRKDSEVWGQENNRQLKFLKDKLVNGEELSEDELTNLAEISKEQGANPLDEVIANFNKAYPLVKGVYTSRGEDPDSFLEAFDASATQEIRNKLVTLSPEDQVVFILEEGKKLSSSYNLLKTHGSLEKTIEAVKKEAIEEYKKSLGEDTNVSEDKPKMRAVHNSEETEVFDAKAEIASMYKL